MEMQSCTLPLNPKPETLYEPDTLSPVILKPLAPEPLEILNGFRV